MKIGNLKLKIGKKGFTLIELMVVIGIVILITIGSIAGIAASRNRRQVKTTAEKLKYVVAEAISQAKTPDDTLFGLQKIEIDVYPWDSSVSTAKNQVKVYNCYDTACTVGPNKVENPKLSFSAPKGVYLTANNPPTDGNMSKSGNVNYYYFSVIAAKNITYKSDLRQIGQLSDYTSVNANDLVFLKVMASDGGGDIYDVKTYINSGLVIIVKE